jgi:parvulin-like peptidyl-prolyl isomerase
MLRQGCAALRWCRAARPLAVRCSSSQQPRGTSSTRKVKVAHIQLAAGDAGRATLAAVRAQLDAGGDFAQLAQAHSTCASKGRGGQLGWLYRGTFLPQFDAALAAPVGAVVEVETARGLHLIQVQEEAFEAQIQQMSVQELADYLGSPALAEGVQVGGRPAAACLPGPCARQGPPAP